MENNRPLLSICIPTSDRGKYLIENLNVLIPQLKNSKYNVELVISENGSSETNFRLVKDYVECQDYPIKFVHTKENIGGRANFDKAIHNSHGRYAMLLGDDDILSPNFIDIICPILELDNYSLLHINFLVSDENLQYPSLYSNVYENVTKEYTPFDFMTNMDFDITFMSSLVFKRECWDCGYKHVRDEYYGYEWLSAICWGVAQQNKPCLFYFFPLCIQRNPPRTWKKMEPIYKYLGQGLLYKDLDSIQSGYFEVKKKYFKKRYFKKFLIAITKEQSFYRPYEHLFKEVLSDEEYISFRRCLYTRFPSILRCYYNITRKLVLLKDGLIKFIKC